MLETAWFRSTYGSRDEIEVSDTAVLEPVPAAGLPENLEQRAAVLAAQNDALRQANSDLRTQADRLEKELDRRAEERREENELQKQNNVLMQQIYNLLSRMQDSSGLSRHILADTLVLSHLRTNTCRSKAELSIEREETPMPRE